MKHLKALAIFFLSFAVDSYAQDEALSDGKVHGYFMSPAGLATNHGTIESPWDIKSALETQEIPAGATLYALPGVYPRNAGVGANVYAIKHCGIVIKPFESHFDDPYTVVVEAGIQFAAGSNDNVIENIMVTNPTKLPFAEPTAAGSPYPGHPAPEPGGWGYWAAGGTFTSATNSGNSFRYCVASGGAGGFSAFQSRSLTIEGCIAFGVGWEAVDRRHGHCYYLQNPSNAPGDRNFFTSNIGSTSQDRLPNADGRLAFCFFSTKPNMQNWAVTKSYAKGSILCQSERAIAQNMLYSDIVGEAARIGTAQGANGGDNAAWGRPSRADTGITLRDILYVNGRKVADNCNITDLTQSNIRQVKTRAAWYVTQMDQPDAFSFTESGTHLDAVAGKVRDEYRVHVMPNDPKQAHVYIVDFDNDGKVDVDLATHGFAGTTDSFASFHYKTPGKVASTGDLIGGTVIAFTIVETNPVTSLLDSTEAYIVRLK
ncbi:MAG: hypothetical protein O3C21_11815 [Verrucomicrobia bacterium]|nr:hypothetical protein [Verrucomicrobiota bacterium]